MPGVGRVSTRPTPDKYMIWVGWNRPTEAMNDLFQSGRVIDGIIALLLLEGLILYRYHHRTRRGPALPDIMTLVLSGVCLLLALRLALSGAAWPWLAAALLGALAAHLADLYRRW